MTECCTLSKKELLLLKMQILCCLGTLLDEGFFWMKGFGFAFVLLLTQY